MDQNYTFNESIEVLKEIFQNDPKGADQNLLQQGEAIVNVSEFRSITDEKFLEAKKVILNTAIQDASKGFPMMTHSSIGVRLNQNIYVPINTVTSSDEVRLIYKVELRNKKKKKFKQDEVNACVYYLIFCLSQI